MTGDTLQDLVERGGPLAIGDAVARDPRRWSRGSARPTGSG